MEGRRKERIRRKMGAGEERGKKRMEGRKTRIEGREENREEKGGRGE